MTSVEKHRSSRRSRGHRKHSTGGFSKASSGGSFLDETDREVSNLTDRAFRSLCIGDEAVYNDSDLSLSSPSTQRDRQLAFSQDRDILERDREEQKRAAQDNFSLRVQQYGQDWVFGGMSGADIYRDPQWEAYGERTQGMVSATFQHSFVETSQQGKSLREGELSLFSNGASEFGSQQRRSRSRVSSLVRAFNSDGHRDEAGLEAQLREWSDGTSWDRSALMSIQRELSEFSTSYQQNFNSHHFSSASPFSPQNTNVYSSQVGAMAQMSHNSASAYMRSSHIKHNMSAQVNSNFMHSEFSPFRLWRDHNRFPFHQGELSGFMQCSEFPKWYQTPMYNELSLANQSQDPYRDLRHQRNTLALAAPSTHSISTSKVLQKSSVEKRCESELAGHYPHRKWTQSLGTNKLPSQRPSTASPTTEMSRRVRDTIGSVKALQQKVKIMSEQHITTDETAHKQGVLYGREHLDNPVNSAITTEPNVFSSNTRSAFGTNQLLTPLVYAHQEAETSNFHQYEVSPQPVEHPPVRAESRGATPDVRISNYKSRATSLLFNLKDNRKRVKSTYSPTKFKVLDVLEKNKQEPHEIVIDTPVLSDPDIQLLQLQEPRRRNAAVNQYHSSGLSLQTSERTNTGQYPENTSAQTQGQMVHQAGFSSITPENYTNYQLANGQNPYESVASFTPYKQDYLGSMEHPQQSHSGVDAANLNTDNNQSREYLISKANTEQAFNETVGGVSSKVSRYEQLIENKQNFKNPSSLEKLRQRNSQDTENVSMKTDISPSRQDTLPLTERPRTENQSIRNKDVGKVELKESLVFETSSPQKADLVRAKFSNQLESEQEEKMNKTKDGILAQKYNKYIEKEGISQNNLYPTTEKSMIMQNIGQINQFMPVLKEQENQSQQQTEVKPQFEVQKKSSNQEGLPSSTMTHQIIDRKVVEMKSEQDTAENAQYSKEEKTNTELKTQVQPRKTESTEFISTQRADSENIRTEEFKLDPTKLEDLRKSKKEQIKEEDKKGEHREHFTKKELELDGDKKTKAAQTRVQQLTDEPKHITEKAKHEHVTEEQVKAKQAETEKLKEERIKSKLAKTEETGTVGIKQAKVEQPTSKRKNPEQVKEEQLHTDQAEGEQMKAEEVKTENINPEKVEVEYGKEEQTHQVKEPQTKAQYVKIEEDEMIEINTDLIKSEGVREVEKEKDLSHVGQVNAEKPTILICKAKGPNIEGIKTEQVMLKENKLDRSRAELSTTENLLERSDHLTAKLTAAQHAIREPDKVEQVKTELAKAKAELAKIKEKMRGEQKEKTKNNSVIKEGGSSKNSIPLSINMDKKKDGKKQDQSIEIQTHRGADDYEQLREKYGLTNAIATNRNKMLTGSANEIDNTLLDEAGKENNAKLKDGHSPACSFIAANTENKKEVSSAKYKEMTETQSVHSESSKEFKLSGANSFPTDLCNETKQDTSPDKLKKGSSQKLEKCDSVNDTLSQQRDSGLDKLFPLQRKPESNENSTDLSKDLPVTPPRGLSQKERAQTKQEILTSKIKAHAEKEISAIKEKGFALRDGFIGKGSAKHLASGQSVSIWQRPPSLEVPKNHENVVSSNVSPKHQIEPSGIQTGPVKFAPPQSCAAMTGKPAATTTQLENLEKPANRAMSKNEDKSQKEGGIKSQVQTKEQTTKNNQEKEQANHTDIPGRQKDELQQKVKGEIFNERKEDQTQDAHVKAVNTKPVTTEEVESKEAADMNSAPLNVVVGPNEMTVTDDSLQIMGIMVTVRERKPSKNITQNDTTEKLIAATEKECNKSELNKDNPSQGQDENKNLNEANLAKEMDRKKMLSMVKEDLAKVDQNNYSDNVQQTLSLESKKKDTIKNATEKRENLQHDSSKVNPEPQDETQPEPATEKGMSFTVTVPAKDKLLTETQTVLYKQNSTADKTKDIMLKTAKENLAKSSGETTNEKGSGQQQQQAAQVNESFTKSVVNFKINNSKAESSIKQLSVNKGMTAVENSNRSSNIDGLSAQLQEEKKEKTFNKASSSNDSLQLNEKQSKENIQDVNVHIDSIAIRVVPAVTKEDKMEMVGKNHSKSISSDQEHQQNISSSCKENTNTPINEHCSKGSTPTSSEQKTGESLEDKLAVQYVLSSVRKLSDSLKASSKQNSTNTSNESCKAENKKPESNLQPVEGDYFQIQGVTETSSEAHSNIRTTEDKLKERELPGLLPNTTAISTESCKEIKSEAFVFSLDQSENKASSGKIQDETNKKKNLEREDTLASNQTDGSMKRRGKTDKAEEGQLEPISKRKEEKLHLSTMERPSSRESQPPKTNLVSEKSEVKPKPKGRTSTIPEISALADYARLKVIVAEDRDEITAQEFPPNKKEGFFPLIHTRHSRRPVFTDYPQDLSVKEKKLPNKTDASAKVNKEPKSIVFTIMDKEHQRTGMFKLGDKEKHEKMVLDTKMNVDLFENKDKNSCQKETNKSSTQTENLGQERLDPRTGQTNNHQVMTPSFVARKADNKSSEVLTYLHPTMGQHQTEILTHPEKCESPEIQKNKETRPKTEDGGTGEIKQEKLTTQCKETKAKQQEKRQKSDEEGVSRHEKEQSKEDIKIKNMIEERRASLAEEERKATQREEERRAREREAVAIMIKERREKQRQAEIKAGEERKTKKGEEEKVQKDGEVQIKQKVEPMRTETDERRRMKVGDERVTKLGEKEKERRLKQQKEERNAQEEHQRRAVGEKQQLAIQKEQQRRLAQEEHSRKSAQEEHQKGEAEENKRRAEQKEQQRKIALEEQQRRAAQEERPISALQEEQQQKLTEEQQRRAAQEKQKRRAAQEEQQRRVAQEEQQRRAAQEEQQRRAAEEEQQRRALHEQQRRAVQEEQQKRAAEDEQQRRAAQEEQQKRAAQEELQRRAAQEKQQRRAANEDQQRRGAEEEQQRKAALEERQKRALQEEEQQRKMSEEQQRRASQEVQQRKDAKEKQKRRAVQEEQQRKAAEEEQQRKAAQDEQQKRALREQQRRAIQKEQQRRAAEEEQQRKAAQEEQQRRASEEQQKRVEEEHQRKAAQERQQRRSALIEEQRQAKQSKENIVVDIQEEIERKPREGLRSALNLDKENTKLIHEQKKMQQQTEEHKEETHIKGEWMKTHNNEERTAENENILKQSEELQAKHESTILLEKNTTAQEVMLANRETDAQAKKKEEGEREKARRVQMEKQERAAQKMDALQYYAITSIDTEKKPKERQLFSPLPSHQKSNQSVAESTEDFLYHTKLHKPNAAISPAPPLPRSNVSSPALGVKPSMFRVKDNTFRGSSFTKSVKPRFHKNFGEDFWMGSPSDRASDREEDEQETIRRSAETPVSPEKGLNQFASNSESANFLSASSSQDYSTSITHQRPYSRRSMAMDDDESRSIVSNMSEDVESFATSAADMADVRALLDFERPESACSFSSDVSRSLGKPPTVPPKSEKALRRAQRLTSRRIKKELSKVAAGSSVGVEKEVSSLPSSTEVCSSNHYAVASPHCSPPVAFAHAPTLGSSLPSSHTEHQSSHHSFHASPHATGPISLPISSAHAGSTPSLPSVSLHASGNASKAAAPKTVAHVSSSPTSHLTNPHSAPVTQYHVESSPYHQSYPLTQRKVLQDLGSGQYFLVDVPVQVKTKTFFDPETGKYVQLNVRQSGQNISQSQPQQTYPQAQLQPQMQIKPQQQPVTRASFAGKPFVFYQGYHSYPQSYQPAVINSVHLNRSSGPATVQQHPGESNISTEGQENSEGHRYSPEKTPYMDTVNDINRTYNTVNNTQDSNESLSECNSNNQLIGSSVCEDNKTTNSLCQPRDIIAMSELEDFMEVSDW
ncbi:uncharacterized protein LOC108234057 [Kryptolebias marmoratus]|uniref:uncharacterized protein LOC108234057 n=1 Tax=Kryptolebias marmoratus TaxID=37003 RepID=UPI0007F896D8|nr:uncharacterized protein LOC108234057 [Kryptolebias marmoratus]